MVCSFPMPATSPASKSKPASTARPPRDLLDQVAEPRDAVLLYGSHARGDQRPDSDIDVLQVVPSRRPSYRRGKLSVATTTAKSLHKLAASGSLFVLHLKCEGVVLRDTAGVLERTLASYQSPTTYAPLLESLVIAAKILDVSPQTFATNPAGFIRLSRYLLRTTAYVRCLEAGEPLFSIRAVAERLRDPRIVQAFSSKDERSEDIAQFYRLRELLEEFLGAPARNEHGSIEALAVLAYERAPLASALALRLLGGSSMEYEDLLPDGIAP